ncbi:LIRP-like [Toxorhynchites rutilus septentrionalis]|uniref:LIRP-like n=1 Tax=Toxorhynchites rutilus septentrionalis TaxID=329112 RepID=UPI00247B1A51|nr:LIRP-like [Toxorhynchites rutilus septentrionalis]
MWSVLKLLPRTFSRAVMPLQRQSVFSVIFIVCCSLLVLVVALSEAGRVEHNSTEVFHRVTRDRRRYCGKALTDALALVCNSYPSPWKRKFAPFVGEDTDDDSYREQLIAEIRQDLDELEQLSPEMFDDKPVQYHPFYPRFARIPVGGTRDSHRRVRRQIVDKCCRQSCTISTLKQYCAD